MSSESLIQGSLDEDSTQIVPEQWYSDINKNLCHQLCRICAKYHDYLIPIYQGEGLEHELGFKISTFLPFEISENDSLPKYCCHLCASVITEWSEFVVDSKYANERLISMFLSNGQAANQEVEITHNDKEVTEAVETVEPNIKEVHLTVDKKNGTELCNSSPSETTTDKCKKEFEDCTMTMDVVNSDTEKSEIKLEIIEVKEGSDLATCNEEIDTNNEIIPLEGNRNTEDEGMENVECDTIFDLEIDEDHITTVLRTTDGEEKTLKNKTVRDEPKLQAYKFHMPVKYVTINGHQFLRTKVFGFELTNAPEINQDPSSMFFICCLCNNIVKDIDVIGHSKTHYPLKSTDSCKLCHFGFSSIDCFRLHLKKHVCFIDEEFRKPLLDDNYERDIENDPTFHSGEADPVNISSCRQEILDEESEEVICSSYGKSRYDPFVCEYCGIVYKFKKTFLQHVRRAHVSRFFCNACKKRFTVEASLKKHKCLQVIPKKPGRELKLLNCKCKKIFLIEEQYLEHMKSCEKAKYLPCKDCGRDFANTDKLESHILKEHIKLKESNQGKPSIWVCEICGCLLSAVSAKKHYKTHSFLEKKFVCGTCDMKFITKKSLEKHVESHSSVRPFVCNTCHRTFKRKDHLKKHMETKHDVLDDRKYECKKCRRYFTTHSFLLRHERLHSQGVSYECAVCKSRYPTEQTLKMHQTKAKHDNETESGDAVLMKSADWANRFRCHVCHRRYGSFTSLKKHIFVHHKMMANLKEEIKISGDKEIEIKKTLEIESKSEIIEDVYECSKCSKRFLSAFGLKLHLSRSKHAPVTLISKKKRKLVGDLQFEKNPRFICNKCNEMFCSLLSLKMHKLKRQHFSKCPNCDKRFLLDFKLRNHLIKVHHRNDLDENVSEYTQAEYKPYQCKFCKQNFAMEHNYLIHLQKKHSNREEPITSNEFYIESNIMKQETADGDTSIIYHCTECWDNFFTEEEFNNHIHVTIDADESIDDV